MSIILPGNLSTTHTSGRKPHNNARPPSGAWFPPECEPEFGNEDAPWVSNVSVSGDPNSRAKEGRKNTMPSAFDSYASLGFDEYGTELGKEARVWKVYVKETDVWDTELVDGWNKFIIESTGALQEDRTDATAQTLLQISHTLYAIANNSAPPEASFSGTPEAAGFSPSRTLIIVNTLWYLSLALSIATSFLAILAKDWCHSFMANRSGHPCIQARRRQRKWTMIEQWKMQELLATLPLLIHIALLLFAIGLCIYIWDVNRIIAIPVICVTGCAALFYAGSTLAATAIDSFPYTTIVSRILGSEVLRFLYTIMKAVGVYLVLAPSIFILRTITRVGDRWERLKTQVVEGWLRSLDVRDNDFRDWFRSRPWATNCAEVPSQDVITSRALGWIIKYCEVPQAIDIALQAIAGANERLPREPLEECRASSALSQHLASSSLYKGEKTNEQRISLYLRALSFLGSDDLLQSTGDIEVVLWDMQAENEMKVSALLTDGGFTPDDHNLAALRIDNMAASQVLSLLKDNNHDGMVVLNSILLLLRQHTNGSRRLHPAARLALLNAASLLGSCMPNHLVPTELAGLCIEIFTYNHIFYSLTDDFHLEQRLVVIVLLQGRPISSDHSVSGRSSISLHAIRIFQGFLTLQSSSRETLEHFVWFGVLEILSNRSQYRIGPSSDNEHSRLTLEHAQNKTVSIMETLPRPENHNLTSSSAERLAFPVIQSLNQIYTTASVGAPDGGVYMFVVECMLCVWSHRMDRLCWSIMSTLCFPKPSVRLVAYMEKRSLIQVFHKHMEVSYDEMKFFAAAQLWLLFALYIDPLPLDPDSPMAPEVDMKKLKALLEQSPLLKGDASNIGQAMEELGLQIEELEAGIKWEEGPPTIYALRVLECVLQSRGCASSDPRWVKINNELVDTPAALRGLGSFTPLPMRQPYGYTSPSGIPNEEYVSIPVDHEEKIEIQEAKNTGSELSSV